MANEETKQENYFNIHDHFESIEEFELEMSKIYDVCEAAMAVVLESKLPEYFKISIMQHCVDTHKHMMFNKADKLSNISTLLDFLHDQHSDQGE